MAGKPRFYIPTLYFIEGLPFTMVNTMSVVLYKSLGASNDFVGFWTSLLYIPWTFKLFWAPLVDFLGTRRRWILVSHLVLSALSVVLAVALLIAPTKFGLTLLVFGLLAFTSATQDIAIDGYYLDVLTRDQQAFYVGIRNAAYKVASLFGSGVLVYMAGILSENLQRADALELGWTCAFLACASIFFVSAVLHYMILPATSQRPIAGQSQSLLKEFPKVFVDFMDQPRIGIILTYILIFRVGDALLMKMAQPFLLDPLTRGGVGLSMAEVGLIYGTVGTFFLFAGGILGGALIAKAGLRKYILPFALLQNLALPLYWILAIAKPDIFVVGAVNSFEQFSYGLGTSAYTVFLLSTVKNRYRAAHYAIVTAFMALGVMLPGMVSGYLATSLGYDHFFLLSFFYRCLVLSLFLFYRWSNWQNDAWLPDPVDMRDRLQGVREKQLFFSLERESASSGVLWNTENLASGPQGQ